MQGSNTLAVLNPCLVNNAVLGDIRSVLHADHVAVSVIEEAPGAEVRSVLGGIIAEVEVLCVLDVLAANAGFGGIVSNVRILEAVQTTFLRGDNVSGLNAHVMTAVIFVLLEGVGEQDIIILCKTGGLAIGDIAFVIIRVACVLKPTALSTIVAVAIVGVVVFHVKAIDIHANSVGDDSNQIFALLVVVARSRGLGDLVNLAQPGVDGADTVDSLAFIVLLRKDLRQGALCAELSVDILGLILEVAQALGVLQCSGEVIIRNLFAVDVVLSNDLLGLGVGFLDAQSNEELASVELGGEGSLRGLHLLDGLVVVVVIDPLGVGTLECIVGNLVVKLELLVQRLAGLDSASNSQIQLAIEAIANNSAFSVFFLCKVLVKGVLCESLSFLCVLDSVSVQGVQKDLSSFLTGEVSFGLPAISQAVDELDARARTLTAQDEPTKPSAS